MLVDICVCTFRRRHIVRTLASLQALVVPPEVTLRILVADNDETDAARALIETQPGETPVGYIHAPSRNISIARNACLEASDADWVAFIDDDELAEPDWLQLLIAEAQASGADAVFGPARAIYSAAAPAWMVAQDYHSNLPETRGGEVLTGHTCNALLRWADSPWYLERFDLSRGQTGGEDTEFFFRLHRLGARYAVAWEATVYEEVAPARLTYDWLRTRKYRSGQSYAVSATSTGAKLKLGTLAALKATLSSAMALVHMFNTDRRMFWRLRAALHRGVVAGCLSLKEGAHYGD